MSHHHHLNLTLVAASSTAAAAAAGRRPMFAPAVPSSTPTRPADTAVTQLVNARVGLLVPIIRPLPYEKRFWTSEFFHAAANGNDSLHLFMRLASECLHLFRVLEGLPLDIAQPFHTITCKATALVVVHIVFKLFSPDLYWDVRWVIVSHFRLLFLLMTIAIIISIRAMLRRVGLLDDRAEVVINALFMYQTVKGSPTFVTARALLLVSCCHMSLQHSLMPLLPFLLDIPIHMAYLVAIVRYISAPAADIFTRPNYAAATQKLCGSIFAALPTRQVFSPTPPYSPPTAGPCGVQHVWLIILFFQLFLGFCLPVYISYTSERCLKLRFLRFELRQDHAAAAAAAAAAATFSPITASAAQHGTSSTAAPAAAANPTPAGTALQQLRAWLPAPIRLLATKALAAHRLAASLFDWVHCGRGPSGPRKGLVCLALRWLLVCSFHSGMLGLLAVLSWQLVVGLQVPLARHVKLLEFPGAKYSWYWEVLCGTDGPCCPA